MSQIKSKDSASLVAVGSEKQDYLVKAAEKGNAKAQFTLGKNLSLIHI